MALFGSGSRELGPLARYALRLHSSRRFRNELAVVVYVLVCVVLCIVMPKFVPKPDQSSYEEKLETLRNLQLQAENSPPPKVKSASGKAAVKTAQPKAPPHNETVAAPTERKTKKPPRSLAPDTPIEDLPPLEGNPLELPESIKVEDLLIHKGNAAKQQLKDIRPKHLPSTKQVVANKFKGMSCAVVGSSGAVRDSGLGPAITAHDVVLRVNQAPAVGFAADVGNRTDMRILSRNYAHRYALPAGKDIGMVDVANLPLEWGSTLLVSGARLDEYNSLVDALQDKWRRPDVMFLYLSTKVGTLVKKMVGDYRRRLLEDSFVLVSRGANPSQGFTATFLLMMFCQSVTVYGFGLQTTDGKATRFHYWDQSVVRNPKIGNIAYDVEYSLLRTLGAKGYIKWCDGSSSKCGVGSEEAANPAVLAAAGGNTRWGAAFEEEAPQESSGGVDERLDSVVADILGGTPDAEEGEDSGGDTGSAGGDEPQHTDQNPVEEPADEEMEENEGFTAALEAEESEEEEGE